MKGFRFTITKPLPCGPNLLRICRNQRSSPSFRCSQRDHGYSLFKYTFSGKGIFETKGRKYDLLPGNAFICDVNAPDYSYYYPEDGKEPWDFFYLQIQGSCFREWLEGMVSRYGHVYQLEINNPLIKRLLQILDNPGKPFLSASESLQISSNLQLELLRSKEKVVHDGTKSQLIHKAIDLIYQQIHSPISLKSLASQLNVSREHLSRVMTSELGQSPHHYINTMKIEQAQEQLINTTMTIKEIAYNLGFSSPELFTQVFKRQTGVTPRAYRKNPF